MTNRERVTRVLNFQPVDRLPVIEWAHWWNLTVDRWHAEGLPESLTDPGDICDYFGLDAHRQLWIRPKAASCPPPPGHGMPLMRDREDYLELKQHLYPDPAFDPAVIEGWAKRQATDELVVWITLEGFFWFPRTLFGIEPHLYAFYDQPDLMREMNDDLLAFNLRVFDEFCDICVPDFMTFAEDMSYNHGPMVSAALFDELLAPHYHQIVPHIHERGTVSVVDTDGDVTTAVRWYTGTGIQGFLPLERMAGVDVNELRRNHPDLRMIVAFDKTVMHLGEERIRREFERLEPAIRSGGYIPSVDHQTPPEVSMEDYRLYVSLLREYAQAFAPTGDT